MLNDFRSGNNLVVLDQDVREAFPDDKSVNEALRVIAKVAKQQAARASKTAGRHDQQHGFAGSKSDRYDATAQI